MIWNCSCHKDLFDIYATDEIDPAPVERLIVVDVNRWNRLDRLESLRKRTDLEIFLWDHHMITGDIEAVWKCQEKTGATVTLLVRHLRKLRNEGCTGVPVVADNRLAGIISRRDLW